MEMRRVQIMGVGKYLPRNVVTAEEIDEKLGTRKGWVARKAGVLTRHFVDGETASQMGAAAAREALMKAGLKLSDIDCIVCASGTMEQAIPCTASLIYSELDPTHMGIPAFDINSTCLSFVTAFDHMSYLITAGRYRHILIVSTEIASVGLDWKQKESSALFGDGAAAVVLGPTPEGEKSALLSSRMETYSQGAHLSEIRGGGTKHHPRTYGSEVDMNDFLFDMDGEALFRLSARHLPGFISRLLPKDSTGSPTLSMNDMDLVVPHQASMMAMRLIQRRLGISKKQMFIFAQNHGNTIASSIPIGIYEAIQQGQIQRGDTVMLLGTSAGLSLGGVIFVY